LAVANAGSNSVSILLGGGSGSFGTATDFGVGTSPSSVAVADFNRDGKLDLAVANDDSGNVSVLLGTGTGSFGAAANFGVGLNPSSVTVGDFNRDGKLDLAVANEGSNTVSVLPGTGTGSFGPAFSFIAGTGPLSVAAADLDGDGRLDLAVANSGSDNVSVLLGTGAGGFRLPMNFAVGDNPHSVAIGDLDGDGKLDLAVASQLSGVSVLNGTGTGSFTPGTALAVRGSPVNVELGDFTGDGTLDLAVAKAGANKAAILINTCTPAPDADGDGLPDAIDPCTNVGRGQDFVAGKHPKITLFRINADATAGDDEVTIAASFTLGVNNTFAGLNPLTRGARVMLQNGAGARRVDVTLGAGSFAGKGTRGWQENRAHSTWTYRDTTGSPLNGISRLQIKDDSRMQPRRVSVRVTGRNGFYPVVAGDEPLKGIVVLGDQTDAVAGACGESAFAKADCAFNTGATMLNCNR
jgi:hypothetical protein